MATYRLNQGLSNERDIDADYFKEEGSMTIFRSKQPARSERSDQVFAIPTSRVESIELVEPSE